MQQHIYSVLTEALQYWQEKYLLSLYLGGLCKAINKILS